jgi:hypothetical protein
MRRAPSTAAEAAELAASSPCCGDAVALAAALADAVSRTTKDKRPRELIEAFKKARKTTTPVQRGLRRRTQTTV